MLSFLQKNRTIQLLLLLIAIHVLFLIPLLGHGIPYSHDGEVQVARFAAYIKAFNDGEIPPRWAKDLNYGYGLPILNFYYPLPGYLASVLSLTKLSLENIFLALSGTAFLFAPLGMYLFLSAYTSRKNAFLAALLYGLAPYQFLNLYVRGDIGESLALALFPFTLYYFVRGVKLTNTKFVIIGGCIAALVILAHHGLGLMLSPLLLCAVVIISWRHPFNVRYVILFIVLWFGISAFFWMPAFFEQKYTLATVFIGDMYKHHFVSFPKILYAPWGFGADVNTSGGQSPQIGIAMFFLLLLSLFYKHSNKNTLLRICFFLFFLLSVFLVTSYSSFIWQHMNVLQKYQFPWRFIGLSTISAAFTVGLTLSIKNKAVFGLCVLLIVTTAFLYTKTTGKISHEDEWYYSFPSTTFFHGEALTIWSEGEATSPAEHSIDIIAGEAIIKNVYKKTQVLRADVESKSSTTLRINTLFYPGWKAYVDNGEVPIQFQDPNNRGLITFTIPQGTHIVQVLFTETKLRLFADIISLLSVMLALVLFIKPTIIGTYVQK